MRDPTTPVRTALHELWLLPDVHHVLDRAYDAIAAAKRRVWIECYIVSSDNQGAELYRALALARSHGCDVRVLYDPLGSEKTKPEYFDSLRALGVEVRGYGRLVQLHSSGIIAPRDHGRVMVMDDLAFTGGAAWGEQWLPVERGGRGWHDVCCRVKGPCVEDFARLFEMRWDEAVECPQCSHDYDTHARYPDMRLVGDTPSRDKSSVYEAHVEAFARAQKRIWLENAYFYPPAGVIHELADAVKRGVDVRVLIPGESDLPIIRRAARADYAKWLDLGIKLFEYEKTVLHSKFAVVDDAWGSVGTFNMNPVSVGLSNEVNLFVFDPTFVDALASQFVRDLGLSAEVTREQLAERPMLERAGDQLAKTFWKATEAAFGPKH